MASNRIIITPCSINVKLPCITITPPMPRPNKTAEQHKPQIRTMPSSRWCQLQVYSIVLEEAWVVRLLVMMTMVRILQVCSNKQQRRHTTPLCSSIRVANSNPPQLRMYQLLNSSSPKTRPPCATPVCLKVGATAPWSNSITSSRKQRRMGALGH